MGALTLETVRRETEAKNDSFIRDLYFSSNPNQISRARYYVTRGYGEWDFSSVDVQAAFEMYQQVKEQVLHYGSFAGKYLRPYLYTDVNDMGLDPEQPWVGWEFETGYASPTAMRQALGYCWDNFDNVTFDSEGEGAYYSEVTFAPANLSSFVDEAAPAAQYIKYLSDNRELTYFSGEANVGTHVNISLPRMRKHTPADHYVFSQVVTAMNRSLGTLSRDDNQEFFGRERLYAGFFHNSDGKDNSWFEGKVFRTTYDYEVYKKYVRVSRGLIKAIEALLETNGRGNHISNMFELLSNPDDVTPIIGDVSGYTSSPSMSHEGYSLDSWDQDNDDSYYDDEDCDCHECRSDRGEF